MERQEMERAVYKMCVESRHGSDLLVSAFAHSLRSYRRSSVCMPFPTAYFHSMEDHQEKDYAGALETLQDIPSLDSIVSTQLTESVTSPEEMQSPVNPFSKMPLRSLHLLHWILNIRCNLSLVQHPEKEVSAILPSALPWRSENSDPNIAPSPNFVLQCHRADSKKGERNQSEFELSKNKFGSIYAYHGTSSENLHSILRCGLLNLSSTALQRNGVMFGEGIYLSTDLSVALTFSKASEGWSHSYFGENLKYVLLCEIAKGDKVIFAEKNKKNPANSGDTSFSSTGQGSYIVVQNSDLLRVRYVFVYVEPSLQMKNLVMKSDIDRRKDTPTIRGWMQRQDFCRMLVVLYVVLLLGISYMKSSGLHSNQKMEMEACKRSRL